MQCWGLLLCFFVLLQLDAIVTQDGGKPEQVLFNKVGSPPCLFMTPVALYLECRCQKSQFTHLFPQMRDNSTHSSSEYDIFINTLSIGRKLSVLHINLIEADYTLPKDC